MLLCDAHLHFAPLVQPKRILDIGTGTGIWAIQMAEQYPESTIWGTDLSPIQPSWYVESSSFRSSVAKLPGFLIMSGSRSTTSKHQNGVGPTTILIIYIQGSCWLQQDHGAAWYERPFSEPSIRLYIVCTHIAIVRHIKPGGYFEMQELDPRFRSDDGSLREDSNVSYWSRIICEASASYNRPIPEYTEYIKWFEKAGFVDVKRIYLKSPTNTWPKDPSLKEVGKFQLLAHVEGLEGISLGLMTRQLGWKADEVKVLMAKVRPELKDRSVHSYQMK